MRYSALTASTLSGVNLLIGYVSLGIIVVLLAVSVFLISNTVTIGISVRREEINIMKYIGATDFFVRAPFVLEGMLIGLIGAAIPLWVVHYFYGSVLDYAAEKFSMLSHLLIFLPAETIFGFLAAGVPGRGCGHWIYGQYLHCQKTSACVGRLNNHEKMEDYRMFSTVGHAAGNDRGSPGIRNQSVQYHIGLH